MRQILFFAVVVLVAGGYAAQFADKAVTAHQPQASTVQQANQSAEPNSYGRTLELVSDRLGHFHAEARVDGARLEFVVDTGASQVVLRDSAAAEAGFHPMPVDYRVTVSTANGKVKAAPARIERIEIGDITVFDVPALVLPDDVLSENLLGVSFLSRLKRYEVANGRMVLEQ